MASGRETELTRRSDVVWQDELGTAFVAPRWWEAAPGHVIVIPNEHFATLYELPDALLGAVYSMAKRLAVALKDAYGCDGTMTRQHNEAAGGQEVWHFHVHVFPRYEGDGFYERHGESRWTEPAERAPYATRLRRRLRPAD